LKIVGQHQTVFDVYFSQNDPTGSGAVGAVQAMNFLKQSKLKDGLLREIWDLSDPTGKGYLDRQNFYICLKLVALAQLNQPANLENLNIRTPPPKLVTKFTKLCVSISILKCLFHMKQKG
jgi:epidermal growth factor receptor substrate 15